MEAQEIHDIRYVQGEHKRQRLDLYLPQSSAARRPLIVYIHGGAFMFGTKETELVPKHLLRKGYAIASLDYRLSGDAVFPAALQDCKSAVRWLRAHADVYKLDPDHFVAWGESAGGHQAAMLGTTGHTDEFEEGEYLDVSSAVQGVVDYYAPTDFLQMDPHSLPGSQLHNHPESPESRYLGCLITEHPERVQRANPISYISSSTPPFFIAHGTDDHIVPFHQSELLAAALERAGARVSFHRVEGAEHVFRGISPEQSESLNALTEQFLETIFSGEQSVASA